MQEHVRSLRENMTQAERVIWMHLRAKRFSGFKFRRQSPIGRYIVDFVCFQQKLIVELDGGHHSEQIARDEERTRWLNSQGFQVLRFWNNDVLSKGEAVLEAIFSALNPSPQPSPTRGEGASLMM